MLFALAPEREAVVLVAGTIPAAGRPWSFALLDALISV
jgi:hypothetical protein